MSADMLTRMANHRPAYDSEPLIFDVIEMPRPSDRISAWKQQPEARPFSLPSAYAGIALANL